MKLCHSIRTSASPKTGLQYKNNSPYLREVQWDISDVPFVQNKDSQCYISCPKVIDLLVPEKKIFKRVLPYMGMAATFGHVTFNNC